MGMLVGWFSVGLVGVFIQLGWVGSDPFMGGGCGGTLQGLSREVRLDSGPPAG